MYTFGFIGWGNMGGTLATAVAKTEESIALCDRSEETLSALSKKIGAKATDNKDIYENAEYIVLGVKPQVLPIVLEEMAPYIKARKDAKIITMAAGVKIENITAVLGDIPVIRIMPNTPAAIGEGMMVFSANNKVTAEFKGKFLDAFSASGEIAEIPENLIDSACAVSGCGPAFVYMFISALADGGVKAGLSRELSLKLAAKTVSGAAGMVLETGTHPDILKDAVCSPAGSTIEGVESLEKDAFRGTVMEAVEKAFKRTKELG